MSCESKYEQFRYLKAFEISGKPIDTILKNSLQRYKVVFHNQSEIFKPPSTLEEFSNKVEQILLDNDRRFQLDKMILINKDLELQKKDLTIKNQQLELELLRIKTDKYV
jgi:hypothetical protein